MTVIKRWALWSPTFGLYKRYPREAEELYESRRAAIAARLSGSHYPYRPIKIELHMTSKRSKANG
jgi:hypothetical protein